MRMYKDKSIDELTRDELVYALQDKRGIFRVSQMQVDDNGNWPLRTPGSTIQQCLQFFEGMKRQQHSTIDLSYSIYGLWMACYKEFYKSNDKLKHIILETGSTPEIALLKLMLRDITGDVISDI